MLLLIIRSTIGSTKDSNILSFPVSPCTFFVYIVPFAGQVSLGLFSLFGSSERQDSPILVVLVFVESFDGRMGMSGW